MKKPIARPTGAKPTVDANFARGPRAFAPSSKPAPIETFEDEPAPQDLIAPPPRKRSFLWRVLLGSAGILISLGVALAVERLVRDLFSRYEWLGWASLTIASLLVIALAAIIIREIIAIARLARLDRLRLSASNAHEHDSLAGGKQVIAELQALYADRPDMARPRRELDENVAQLFDGRDMVETAERSLMLTLDNRARALTSASARRVAIVTAISPRALVDIAFVSYESFRLARAIAELYGARPGLIGSWRLAGAILGHLAVTGGVALGDSVVQQLLGHGLAAKLSARLGEGLVNGLMTVRVGIAAMRVVRPLPFVALNQPVVMDFMADIAKIANKTDVSPQSRD